MSGAFDIPDTTSTNEEERNVAIDSADGKPRKSEPVLSSSYVSEEKKNAERRASQRTIFEKHTLEWILPNLRDIALSSGLFPKMKEGVLFRSARHFASSPQALREILCQHLNIRSVIDLRDDDLSAFPDELASRRILMRLFGLQINRKIDRQTEKLLRTINGITDRYHLIERALPPPPAPASSQVSYDDDKISKTESERYEQFIFNTSLQIEKQSALSLSQSSSSLQDKSNSCAAPTRHPIKETPSTSGVVGYEDSVNSVKADHQKDASHSAANTELNTLDRMTNEDEDLEDIQMASHQLANIVPPINSLREKSDSTQIKPYSITRSIKRSSWGSVFAYERQQRKLIIINVLDSPGVKDRIKEEVVNSYALPFMVIARLADKLTGSALAPYYFCKYFVSMRNILESYIEILKYCGSNFCLVLKTITIAETPILFHCTLGKDRTGLTSMLVLSILGASDDAIIYDYSQTESAGDQFNAFSYKFIVEQSGLSEKFMASSGDIMRETLDFIRRSWVSVDGYLDWIGFDDNWRGQMRRKFLVRQQQIPILPDCKSQRIKSLKNELDENQTSLCSE